MVWAVFAWLLLSLGIPVVVGPYRMRLGIKKLSELVFFFARLSLSLD